MANVKIPDEGEVVRWIKANKTYRWIQETIQEKYNVTVGISTLADVRRRHGIERRQVRDDELIPWAILPQHRHYSAINILRALARRRAGQELTDEMAGRLDRWLQERVDTDSVLHYDGDTEEGFFYVKRRPEIDLNYIREPEKRTAKRSRDKQEDSESAA